MLGRPHPSNFRHLDATASRLSSALRDANIYHLFLGGYATGLLSGNRITGVIFFLYDRPWFQKSIQSDNLIGYRYCHSDKPPPYS